MFTWLQPAAVTASTTVAIRTAAADENFRIVSPLQHLSHCENTLLRAGLARPETRKRASIVSAFLVSQGFDPPPTLSLKTGIRRSSARAPLAVRHRFS